MPRQAKLWEYLDQKFTSGYQDTLVLHLEPSPLRAELAGEEGRYVCSELRTVHNGKLHACVVCMYVSVMEHCMVSSQLEGKWRLETA